MQTLQTIQLLGICQLGSSQCGNKQHLVLKRKYSVLVTFYSSEAIITYVHIVSVYPSLGEGNRQELDSLHEINWDMQC